jgi:predicted dehydrogenase
VNPIRLAVVGAGIMGANHARVSRALPTVELVAVVDPDLGRARALAAGSGARASADVDDVLGSVDAAVIAVPTAHHLPVAERCIAAGVHVLVEKPLGLGVDEARRISDLAARAGVVLAVGHVERFNAAVVELGRFVQDPLHIEATRVSPYTARVADGVIMDLMIHDIDVVLSIAGPGAEVVSVAGIAKTVHGAREDLAVATVGFSTGLTASFTTSRLAQQKVRTVEVTQVDSAVVADLVRQDLTIYRMSRHEYLADEGRRYRQSSVVEVPFLEQRGEPLALELAHFAHCVRTGERPRVDGAAATRAIEVAGMIEAAVARSAATTALPST